MIPFFGLIAIGLLAGAYFTRGWTRIMLILLVLALVQLKSMAIAVKIFSVTTIVIVIAYFLRPRRKKAVEK